MVRLLVYCLCVQFYDVTYAFWIDSDIGMIVECVVNGHYWLHTTREWYFIWKKAFIANFVSIVIVIVVCVTFHWGHWICKVRLYEQRRRSAIDYFAKKYFSREWSLTWNTLLAAFEYNIDLMKIEITACPLLVVTEAFLAASLDDQCSTGWLLDWLLRFGLLLVRT